MAKINWDNHHQWIPMVVEYHGDVPRKWWDFGDYSGSLNSWPILIGLCIPVGTDGTNGFVFESRVCSCTKTIGLSVLLFFLHGINGMMNEPSLRCFCWYQAATLPGLDRKGEAGSEHGDQNSIFCLWIWQLPGVPSEIPALIPQVVGQSPSLGCAPILDLFSPCNHIYIIYIYIIHIIYTHHTHNIYTTYT